ncbi:DinB family protein [Aquimarina litoralis]|uniref:DinB family protein n=1 Tax=Aquimarina litoralis TaxID=584605 RepID=UPI001C580E4A|nr:DinB family protein [Aquimarina litoralis]MBW1297289.1 DinB family protein [Aquimarina litoralis]
MIIKEVNSIEFDPYYGRYMNKLSPELDIYQGFQIGKNLIVDFFQKIPDNKLEYRYDTGKWSVKEILQHLIDTERIFMYRCFRIAREDKTPLAGFNQDIYIEPSGANDKTMSTLLDEFKIGRENSISLLESLSDRNLQNIGNANGGSMSARAAASVIIGHEIWHVDIIKERYL